MKLSRMQSTLPVGTRSQPSTAAQHATYHMRIDPSKEEVTSCSRFSGFKTVCVTRPVWPLSRLKHSPVATLKT